jgi:hypothetical protein
MTLNEARRRAEKHFKVEQRAAGSRGTILAYEEQACATRSKIARLHTLRLARDAAVLKRFKEASK